MRSSGGVETDDLARTSHIVRFIRLRWATAVAVAVLGSIAASCGGEESRFPEAQAGRLVEFFDPAKADIGFDPDRQYVSAVAVGRDGTLYLGIGERRSKEGSQNVDGGAPSCRPEVGKAQGDRRQHSQRSRRHRGRDVVHVADGHLRSIIPSNPGSGLFTAPLELPDGTFESGLGRRGVAYDPKTKTVFAVAQADDAIVMLGSHKEPKVKVEKSVLEDVVRMTLGGDGNVYLSGARRVYVFAPPAP